MGTLGVIAGAAAFLTVGLIAIAVPGKIRDAALRAHDRSPVWLRELYFPAYLRSNWYVRVTKAGGVLCIIVAIAAVVLHLAKH